MMRMMHYNFFWNDTAKVYLDAVAADADSEANVTFDTVESVEDASETVSDATTMQY